MATAMGITGRHLVSRLDGIAVSVSARGAAPRMQQLKLRMFASYLPRLSFMREVGGTVRHGFAGRARVWHTSPTEMGPTTMPTTCTSIDPVPITISEATKAISPFERLRVACGLGAAALVR